MKTGFLRYLLAAAGMLGLTVQAQASDDNMNVVLIIVDDLRPELGCYGASHVKTPHIDKLAASSMVFDRAYCSSPVCGPSRASMLTGTRLTKPSHYAKASVSADVIFPGTKGIARLFKDAGYTTVAAGKVYHDLDDHENDWTYRLTDYRALRDTPEHRAFAGHRNNGKDKPLPELTMVPVDPASFAHTNGRTGRGPIVESPDVPDDAYTDGKLASLAVNELAALKRTGKPFFLACGFTRPHLPFYAPKRYWDLYDRETIPLARNDVQPEHAPKALRGGSEFMQYNLLGNRPGTEPFARMMKHGYLASTSYVDAQIGKVLAAIEELGLAQRTIVVLWGDHGWNLGEHTFWGKHNLVDTATRLPLIIHVPDYPAGHDNNVVESVDILPTLCDLASVDLPTNTPVAGTSLRPLLEKPGSLRDRPAFSCFGNGRTVITKRHSYTEYGDGGPGKRMLFDLENDRDENVNVSEDPRYKNRVEELSALLRKRREQDRKSRPRG